MENFDALAKDFDLPRRIQRAEMIAEKIREHIAGGELKFAIEYGCGTGLVGLQLADCFCSMLLVDSSPEMISQVKRKIQQINATAVSALCCDFLIAIPPHMHVDCIFSSLVLHHINDTEEILKQFFRMLRNGGQLIIVDFNHDSGEFHAEFPDYSGHNGFYQTELMAMATKIGFSNVSSETFYHGKKAFEGNEISYSLFLLDAKK